MAFAWPFFFQIFRRHCRTAREGGCDADVKPPDFHRSGFSHDILIEVAVTSPNPKIPAPHLARLITLGYVAVTTKGPVVTGDGLIRITESE